MKIKRNLTEVLSSVLIKPGTTGTPEKEESKKEFTFRCPYCFEEIRHDQVLFRAADPNQVEKNDGFDAKPDEVLINFWGEEMHWGRDTTELWECSWGYAEAKTQPNRGTVLGGIKCCILNESTKKFVLKNEDGLYLGAEDTRGKMTMDRVCPECHCLLPAGYGLRKAYFFAMVGTRGTGKTVYLSRLFEIAGALFDEVGLSISSSESAAFFCKNNPLSNDKKLPERTAPGAVLPPVIMTVNTGSESDDTSKEMDLVFYDIAGENCRETAEIIDKGKHIKFADGIILLLSPKKHISGIKAVDGVEIPADEREDLCEVVQAMERAYIGGTGEKVGKSKTRLAVTVSMSDLLETAEFEAYDGVEKADIILRNTEYNSGKKGFMKKEAENISGSVGEFIGGELKNLVKKYYRRAGYFAVSALGGSSVTKEIDGEMCEVAPVVIKSLRIEEPLFWILFELGIIGSVGGKKWTYNGEIVGPYMADGDAL